MGIYGLLLGEYGCVRCQKHHREWEPVYHEHIMCQSKHGVRQVSVAEAIVEAYHRATPIKTAKK